MDILIRNLRNGKEEWFDIPADIDDIKEALKDDMPASELDEDGNEVEIDEDELLPEDVELKVVDIDLDDLSFKCDELDWDDVPTILEFAEWYDELSSHEQRAFCAYCEVGYSNTMENQSDFMRGNYSYYDEKSWSDLGWELIHGMREVPEWLRNYIDYEAYARNSGYTETDFGFIENY